MTNLILTQKLTYELAHELLSSDFETGVLTWKHRDRKYFKTNRSYKCWNTKFSNKKAGSLFLSSSSGKRYYQLSILEKKYQIHRVLWLMKYGYWPKQIDHINGDGTDNSKCNLRSVTRLENMKNIKLRVNNSSSKQGVSWYKANNLWHARINVNKRSYHLGYFKYFIIACAMRKEAEIIHGFHENHGSNRPL